MENGEANDANLHQHQVQDLNGNNEINDDIIMGSIIATVIVFVIAAIIGIYCFYKKNYMKKGHEKIADIDEDEEEIDEGMEINVPTDTIQETEILN